MQSFVVHVKFPLISQFELGPVILVAEEVTLHVLHLGLWQGRVPGSSGVMGSLDVTNTW